MPRPRLFGLSSGRRMRCLMATATTHPRRSLIASTTLSVTFGRPGGAARHRPRHPRAARPWRSSAKAAAAKRCCSRRSSAWSQPTAGEVLFDGQRHRPAQRQEPSRTFACGSASSSRGRAVRQHDVADNVAFPLERTPRRMPRQEAYRMVAERLAEVGLPDSRAWPRSRPNCPAACGSASAWPARSSWTRK